MTWYGLIMETLAGLAVVLVPLALAFAASLAFSRVRLRLKGRAPLARWALALAWLVALTATLGSLYLSEVVGFAPCLLCWYQRIAMYPLAVVLGMALLDRGARRVARLTLPLPVIGLGIAIYHVLIQLQPTMASALPCSADAPCTSRYVAVFGFVSIPVLSGAAFTLIAVALITHWVAEPVAPSADVPASEPGMAGR
jgi:disulfide bond formation protein DsbB